MQDHEEACRLLAGRQADEGDWRANARERDKAKRNRARTANVGAVSYVEPGEKRAGCRQADSHCGCEKETDWEVLENEQRRFYRAYGLVKSKAIIK